MDESHEVAKGTEEHPQPGAPTGLTCPECGGATWRTEEADVVAFRCRVGHKYTAETFAAEQGQTVEAALWASLRLIEERVLLMRQLAERFKAQPRTTRNFAEKADELEQHATVLRTIVPGVAGSTATPVLAAEQ